jgi:hypothetical protein
MIFSKTTAAEGSLVSSTNWRQELFDRAIDEWLSDSRIYWFGRATYSYGVADYTAILVLGGYRASMESSLRRGATHNAITDLLISYGLVGCILSYCATAAMLYFLWRSWARTPLSTQPKDLALLCFTLAAFTVAAGFAGTGVHTMELVWCMILLFAKLRQEDAAAMGIAEESNRPATLSPPALALARSR